MPLKECSSPVEVLGLFVRSEVYHQQPCCAVVWRWQRRRNTLNGYFATAGGVQETDLNAQMMMMDWCFTSLSTLFKSRWWKGNTERLCAMQPHTVSNRINWTWDLMIHRPERYPLGHPDTSKCRLNIVQPNMKSRSWSIMFNGSGPPASWQVCVCVCVCEVSLAQMPWCLRNGTKGTDLTVLMLTMMPKPTKMP